MGTIVDQTTDMPGGRTLHLAELTVLDVCRMASELGVPFDKFFVTMCAYGVRQ